MALAFLRIAEAPAQTAAPADQASAGGAPQWWHGITGTAEPDRLFAGLWTLHLERVHSGLSQHYLLGLSMRGVYATTFISSHGRRVWGLALSRSVIQTSGATADLSFGYRIGIVRGYDRRFIELADRWPVIPAAEIVAGVRYRRIGLLVSWAGVVASTGGFISLDQ